VPDIQAAVVKRYFDGDHLSVSPVGPSPAIMHVDNLQKVTPLWLKLSVDLKHDSQADAAFGWVLEMWGYSIACARLDIKHYVWQQLQIEPSASWHQNVSAERPYIYHYTFGVEYSLDGIPVVGAVGEWSLDKRHYFGGYPPRNLARPPECAQECAWVWWSMFNEATSALGPEWKESRMGGTLDFVKRKPELADSGSAMASSLVLSGPWVINGKHKPIIFFRRGRVHSPWGLGSWECQGGAQVTLSLCGLHLLLTFDSQTNPTSFSYDVSPQASMRAAGTGATGRGTLDASFGGNPQPWTDEERRHPAVELIAGSGPWAWAGVMPMAFLADGRLSSPWGPGHYSPVAGTTDTLLVEFVGAKHKVVVGACNKFHSVREGDGQEVDAWVQLPGAARSCSLI